jgi:Predicted Rossmann fold nucleotide-binding protein
VELRNVCVYCGSSAGRDPAYVEAAGALGRALVSRGLGLVYGGASVGVMGAVADAVLDLGGRAVGVIPEALVRKEIAHGGLTELVVTSSMHERKTRMADLPTPSSRCRAGSGRSRRSSRRGRGGSSASTRSRSGS